MIRELPLDILSPSHNTAHLHEADIIIPENYLRTRRYVEVFTIIVFLPLILVLSFLISLLIAFEGQGKILFIQPRPGRNGKLFRMYKFRTMYNNSAENVLCQEGDPRVTRCGRWLRKYRLDEIPQVWNVLKGNMSFIGPRPVPYTFYHLYRIKIPGYDLRHTVRPGITGYAQVMQGYTSTLEEEQLKLQYDLQYIRNISLRTDLLIIWHTLVHIVKGRS
jgi:lipopolysaccharide/colanic/teichoic acid biosynthesis glycosyltransferase